MMKNKVFILINVFGMATAIACCLVAYFNWEFDATFDDHHTDGSKVYRVASIRTFEGQTELFGHSPHPLGVAMAQNCPDVSNVVRMVWSYSDFKVEDNIFRPHLAYVDSDFFKVFTFNFIEGTPDLRDKSRAIISEDLAIKLFGTRNAVGKQLTQVIGPRTREVTVGGVFRRQPDNQSFHEGAYMNFDNEYEDDPNLKPDSWVPVNTLFVKIDDDSRVGTVAKQIQQYVANNNNVREDFQIREFLLDPFEGMARRDRANRTWSMTRSSSPPAAVVSPIIMSVLVLLIACFNMTNTSIAISSRRLKEIGIRKVMGSMRTQLIFQFLGETLFICFLALVVGLFLGEVLIGSWNVMWENMKISAHYADKPEVLIFLGAVLIFTALVAGSYPAFYISNFEPVSILKGKLKFGGTNYFTRTLLVLQYSFSLIAVIFAIAFYQNSRFQEAFDIGFNEKSIIVAYVNDRGEYQTYRDAIAQNKDITAIAGSKHSIFSSHYSDPVKVESKQIEVDIIEVGDEYVKTMGLSLIAGRDFLKDSETDKKESIIVTEKFAKSFGWDNPLGKEVIWSDTSKLYVIGVIKDVYTVGLWAPLQPMMIRYTGPENYTHVVVSAPVDKIREVNAQMENEWKRVFPTRLYNGRYLDELTAEAAMVNSNIVKLFAFLGIVAVFLSATGLYTLVSLNIIKRMKEIGVRKVLGASIANITRIINTEFVIMLSIASVIGSLASIFTVDLMMSGIWRYYQPAGSLSIIISVIILFSVSAAAIGSKVFGAASVNPVNTLRVE